MNTRIQVEHPVTEMITGLDLVAWMIRVAAGEALDFEQDDVKLNGWAVETRVYAEDPSRGFMPSIGRLVHYREPVLPDRDDGCTVRVDSGVVAGSEISMFYDPMIAKLVTHGPDRAAAMDAMQAALDGFHIRGISHNISFLTAIIAHERFRAGRLTTNFIAEEFPDGFAGGALSQDDEDRLVAVAAFVQHEQSARDAGVAGRDVDRARAAERDWQVVTDHGNYPVTVAKAKGGFRVTRGKDSRLVESDWRPGRPLFVGWFDGEPFTVQVDRRGPWWDLTHGGVHFNALVLSARVAELAARMPIKMAPDLSRFLLSPMPGLLVSLAVELGQEVKAGAELAVVEAMKMENVLRAERDGVVAKVHAQAGASLSVDQAILEFE